MPAGLVLLLSLLVGILTMMARQEYLLNQDKPVEELTKKGQEQCPLAQRLKGHSLKIRRSPPKLKCFIIKPPFDMRNSASGKRFARWMPIY